MLSFLGRNLKGKIKGGKLSKVGYLINLKERLREFFRAQIWPSAAAWFNITRGRLDSPARGGGDA